MTKPFLESVPPHNKSADAIDGESSPFFLRRRTRPGRVLLMLLCIAASACRDSAPANRSDAQDQPAVDATPTDHVPITFRDVTRKSNVESTFRTGREAQRYAILESLGGGVGAVDYDRDGLFDLFLTGGGEFGEGKELRGLPSHLYRNLSNDSFVEVAQAARITEPTHYTQGCSMGDYDVDGFQDILVLGYGGVQLLHNLGDGTFEEVQQTAGLDDPLWSSSGAWGDLNGDGLPDTYLAHYVDWSFENNPHCPSPWPEHDRDVCPPRAFGPLPDVVYFNNGDGTFRDASREAGLREDGKGLGVIMADLDHDADLDVYVANDMVDNFLYRNDGAGHFEDVSLFSGTASDFEGKPNGSMGLAVCDYNGDLVPDLWVTNFEQETFALYRNEGHLNFVHASRESGITALGNLFVGFGTAAGDLDGDGDEDVVISNGHVVYYPTASTERQLPILLENVGGGRFVSAGADANGYFTQEHIGRGLALVDLNNDGRLDMIAGHSNEPAAVLQNTTDTRGRWVRLQLIGTRSGRDAVGARVVLETTAGDQLRHVVGGGSFQSQSETRVHFGLAPGVKPLKATIWWPSGTVQEVTDLQANKTQFVVEQAL